MALIFGKQVIRIRSGVTLVLKLQLTLLHSYFLIRQLLSTSQVSTPHKLYEQ